MRFVNETLDQVRVVIRRHISGDEADRNYVLLPGEEVTIEHGTYTSEAVYREFEPDELERWAAAKEAERAQDSRGESASGNGAVGQSVGSATSPDAGAAGGGFAAGGAAIGGDAGLGAGVTVSVPPNDGTPYVRTDVPAEGGTEFVDPNQIDGSPPVVPPVSSETGGAGLAVPGSENLPPDAQLTKGEMDITPPVVDIVAPKNEDGSDKLFPSLLNPGDPSVEAVEQPPVDNAHVAEGAEQIETLVIPAESTAAEQLGQRVEVTSESVAAEQLRSGEWGSIPGEVVREHLSDVVADDFAEKQESVTPAVNDEALAAGSAQ